MAKTKVFVPMGSHKEGLHSGHIAVLDYASTLADEVVVGIDTGNRSWSEYLRTGKYKVYEDKEIEKMVDAIEQKQHTIKVMRPYEVFSYRREEWQKKADAFIDLYKDKLCGSTELYNNLRGSIAKWFGFTRIGSKIDGVVWGPEIFPFMHKSMSKLMARPPVHIYPSMIKHAKSKVKIQHNVNKIPEHYREWVYRIPHIIHTIKDKVKVGCNDKLAQEVTKAYSQRWSLKDIWIFESNLVNGRLEYYLFKFPTDISGVQINIEEIVYESK